MFRVLIADDEKSVIRSLSESIRWKDMGLEVTAMVSNGYDALEAAKSQSIDIAILDIRMPGINGLELCERLKKERESIQIIIISGYAEFAYAEKAIQYGVQGYCLKPLDYGQMTRALKRAVNNLEKYFHVAIHENILEVLEGRDEGQIKEALERAGFFQREYFVAVSLGEKSIPGLADGGIVINLSRRQWGYLMIHNRIEQRKAQLLEQNDWNGIGYLPAPVVLEQLYGALEECLSRAFHHFVVRDCRICGQIDETGANKWLEEMHRDIKEEKWEHITGLLKRIQREGTGDFTVRNSMKLCNMFFSALQLKEDGTEYYIYSIEQLVSEYGTLHNMLEKLLEFAQESGRNAMTDGKFSNATFMQLIQYVDENYQKDISLTQVAGALYMSPNYVSKLFKKGIGTTFVQYVTQKRVEDARELLTSTDMPLADIAVDVGFNDYFHFIKTFKKLTGLTPGQYRKQN